MDRERKQIEEVVSAWKSGMLVPNEMCEVLVELAEKWLEVNGRMPAKKKCNPIHKECECYRNLIIDQCTIAMTGYCKVPSVNQTINTIITARQKESRKNNGVSKVHDYSDICSCGSCHSARIEAEAIVKYLKEGE